MAVRNALCVIPGSLYEISAWIEKTEAQCLVEGLEFIEAFYNPRRRHSSVGMMTPAAMHYGRAQELLRQPPSRPVRRVRGSP